MKSNYAGRLVLALAIIFVLAGCVSVPAQSSHTIDVNVTGVQPAATPVSSSGGSRALTGYGTNLTSLSLSGNLTIAGLRQYPAATSATVTNGAAFAIVGSWQPITAAATVTPTITIPAAGVEACIENTSAQTINIADSSNQVLTAAFAMGQYDVLCGYSDGTRFIETSRANN